LWQYANIFDQKIEDAVRSPRADSIRTIIGRAPDEFYSMGLTPLGRWQQENGVGGTFSVLEPGEETPGHRTVPENKPKAVIGLSRKLAKEHKNQLDETIAHELGHFADFGVDERIIGQSLPAMTPNSQYVRHALAPLNKQNAENYQKPRPRLDRYSLLDEDERRAQAFANAFDYLQRTASDTADYRGRLGAAEATVPGTGDVAKGLIQRKIYANHPLRGLIR
jgi:hypothetical protein